MVTHWFQKFFRYKSDLSRWGEKTESAIKLGALSPDQGWRLLSLITVTRGLALQVPN